MAVAMSAETSPSRRQVGANRRVQHCEASFTGPRLTRRFLRVRSGMALALPRLMTARLRWLVLFLVLAALASVGCVPSTMRQGHEALVVSPARADAARVVFMRDDDAATHTNAGMAELHVVDGQGRLLGDLAIGTWFAVELPAGLHVFAAWHDGYGGTPHVAALAANLEERRTYFVRTVGRNRFDLDLVRGPLPILPQPTRSARRLDPAAASEWGARFRGRIDAAVRTAKAKLDAGEGASLQPGDGFLLETTAER